LYLFDSSKPKKTKISDNYHPGDPSTIVADDELNPKRLGSFYATGAGCKKMYASAVGADGNIYFGGKWRDNGTAGCLGWVNGETDLTDGFYDIFSNYQVRDLAAAGNGRYIVISTVAIKDTTVTPAKPTPTEGRLFIYDTTLGKDQVMRSIDPISESLSTGRIVATEGDTVVGYVPDENSDSTNSYIYKVDIATGEMVYKKYLDQYAPFSSTGNQTISNPLVYYEGSVWLLSGGTWSDKYLLKISEEGVIATIGKIPFGTGAGDFEFIGNDMYMVGLVQLRKVLNVVK
jgi:hypothetical protein